MANDLPSPPTVAPVPDARTLHHALGHDIGWKALLWLAAKGPLSVNDLAASLNCAQVTVSRRMADLCAAGAVVLVPSPDGDGRKICYAIPPGRLRATAGGKEIDYGVCVLRLPAVQRQAA